jgi:hypothetical protein
MTFGFPAYHAAAQRVDRPRRDVLRAARAALHDLGWRWMDSDRGVFMAAVGVNFWSCGEQVTVVVADDGEVLVRSQCNLPTQCFDWGKNRRNVNRFLDAIERVLEAGRDDGAHRHQSTARVARDDYTED